MIKQTKGFSIIKIFMLLVPVIGLAIVLLFSDKIMDLLGLNKADDTEKAEIKRENYIQACTLRVNGLETKYKAGDNSNVVYLKRKSETGKGVQLWENSDVNEKGILIKTVPHGTKGFITDKIEDKNFIITFDGYCGWMDDESFIEKESEIKTDKQKIAEYIEPCIKKADDFNLKKKDVKSKIEMYVLKRKDTTVTEPITLWEINNTLNKGIAVEKLNDETKVYLVETKDIWNFVITIDGYCGWVDDSVLVEKEIPKTNSKTTTSKTKNKTLKKKNK